MENSSETIAQFRNRTLVIMAKAPRPGIVKTRLSKSLPSLALLSLYRCLLDDTLALAKSLNGIKVAVMCPASDQHELAKLMPNTVQIVAQEGEGLAAGLISVFSRFAATGHPVIAFNADSPHLPPAVLESAFQALAAHEIVIGPTHDGGYYLVGAKAVYPTLFENDGLGTKNALERLLARAKFLELSTGLTESFYDIDVVEDLIRLHKDLLLAPARAPRTAAWFAEWKQTVANLAPRVDEL